MEAFLETRANGENPCDPQEIPDYWVVAKLKPQALPIAEASVQRLGCRSLVPQHQASWRTRFGWRDGLRQLFPGYMFVGIPFGSPLPNGLRYARGISGLLGDGSDNPWIVQRKVMDELLERLDEHGVLRASEGLAPGDEVTLLSGPFSGWLCTVLESGEKDRISLLLSLFGGEVRLDTSLCRVLAQPKKIGHRAAKRGTAVVEKVPSKHQTADRAT